MPTGSCFCGKHQDQIRWQQHDINCRKISGSAYSFCFIANRCDVDISGTAKEVVKNADSGNVVNNYFCQDCGTPMYGGAVTEDGGIATLVIRAGVFDDQGLLSQCVPTVELFTSQRLDWVAPIEGCKQFEGMTPSQ